MTANCFILEILMNSYGRKAIQLRPPQLQELENARQNRDQNLFHFHM